MALWKPTRRTILRAGGLIAAPAIIGRAMAQVPLTGAGRGAPGAAPVTPLTILTNVIGWYKTDIGVTTSLGNVTSVTDQSGAGNNLTPTGGNVPFSATGYTGSLGSKSAFSFVGANGAGLVTGTSPTGTVILPATNAFTFWGIGQCTSAAAGFARAAVLGQGSGNDSTSSQNTEFFGNFGAGSVLSAYNNFLASGTMTKDANHRWIVTCDGSTLTAYVDNSALANTASVTFNLTSPQNIIIGTGWTGGAVDAQAWDGVMCETGIAMSFANSTKVGQLDAYLVGKWGS